MANHPEPPNSPHEALSSAQQALVMQIVERHLDREGALLPLLHEVQATLGCIPGPAVPLIASALNLSRADVHGVVSFYHDFRDKPAGPVHVRICRGEACQAMGGDVLAARVLAGTGTAWGGTSADGSCTVSPVFCLGLCSVAPALMINDEPVARASADTVLSRVGRKR